MRVQLKFTSARLSLLAGCYRLAVVHRLPHLRSCRHTVTSYCSASQRKVHIALSVSDIANSVEDYSQRLGCKPCADIAGQHALWRTDILNYSIRQSEPSGILRHLGFEDCDAPTFSEEQDCNGLTWEHFSAEQQAQEINEIWPSTEYTVSGLITPKGFQ